MIDQHVDHDYFSSTLKLFCQLMSVSVTLLIPLVKYTGANSEEVQVTVVLAVVSWFSLLLVHLGLSRFVPRLLVIALLSIACLAVLASGSVRSAVTVVFLGAVVATGIFLSRHALIASVAFSVTAVGVLTWAETVGWLIPKMSGVGVRDWFVHGLAIILIGYMVAPEKSPQPA